MSNQNHGLKPHDTKTTSAQPTPLTLPDTPAGHQLAGWLQALNTGDPETIRRFVVTTYTGAWLEDMPAEQKATFYAHRLYHATGGLDVESIEQSSDYEIVVCTQARLGDLWVRLHLTVEPTSPYSITGFTFPFVTAPVIDQPKRPLDDPTLVAELDALLDRLEQTDRFSGAVLLARDGVPIYERACGLASRSFNVPNRIDTKFNLASMNKMFTGIAIAQLAEQGKLTFDDLISVHLPQYPPEIADAVTIHHLLTHTSGMGDYWNDAFWATRTRLRTVQDILPLFINDPLAFIPGERFGYSNAGYVVLGAIIEQVSGQSYFDYVREHIYLIAGMLNTDAYEQDSETPNLAIGYTTMDFDGERPAGTRRNNSLARSVKGSPAGGGYSTVWDLLRFAQALRTHRLLGPKYTELVTTGKISTGPDSSYAYGFGDEVVGGLRIVGHNGGAPGISAQLDMYLSSGHTVVVLSNYEPPAATIVVDKLRALIPYSP